MNNREQLLNALVEMNSKCENIGVKPFTVQVFDDFVLLETKPMPIDESCDQEIFDSNIKDIVSMLQSSYGLRPNWLSTDSSTVGKNFENLEFSVGKLEFVLNMDMSVITVMTLPDFDILRVQLIALDCQIMNGEEEYGNRLLEIKSYAERLGMDVESILSEFGEFLVEYDTINELLLSVM